VPTHGSAWTPRCPSDPPATPCSTWPRARSTCSECCLPTCTAPANPQSPPSSSRHRNSKVNILGALRNPVRCASKHRFIKHRYYYCLFPAGVPSAPGQVISTRETDTSLLIQWAPPKEPNNLIGYYIDQCVKGSKDWTSANHKPHRSTKCVLVLVILFRVLYLRTVWLYSLQ